MVRVIFIFRMLIPSSQRFMSSRGVDVNECFHRGSPAPTNVTVKDFARWYCVSRSGRIDHRPNLTSMKNMLKKFFSGFVRVTETILSDEFRNDIYTVSYLYTYNSSRRADLVIISGLEILLLSKV